VVPPPPVPDRAALPTVKGELGDEPRRTGGKRSRYWRWAELLRRTLGLDPEICDRCGSRMEVIAARTGSLPVPACSSSQLPHLIDPETTCGADSLEVALPVPPDLTNCGFDPRPRKRKRAV
jgi:hypothetical protein